MSAYYLDTSAIAKRYVNEPGSRWIRELVAARPRHLFASSRLLIVEIASALTRRLREKLITPRVYRDALKTFDDDCQFEYQLIEATDETIHTARDLVMRYPPPCLRRNSSGKRAQRSPLFSPSRITRSDLPFRR